MTWIKTSDKLPDEGVPVFVANEGKDWISVALIGWEPHPEQGDTLCYHWEILDFFALPDITHRDNYIWDDDYEFDLWHPMIDKPKAEE